MKRKKVVIGFILTAIFLTGCGSETTQNSGYESEQETESDSVESRDNDGDVREGTSSDTIGTPEDFPEEYYYGSGRISDWTGEEMLRKTPQPQGNETVLNTAADPVNIQVLYLWEEGNAPAVTEFTEDMDRYFDAWDFRPYVTAIPVREGVEPKGAVVLMAGGIQAGEFLMHYDEEVNSTVLDSSYIPDELDEIPAHASAAGMIYSFYGRLSVGNMDPEWLAEGNLPPTFYVYGTEDPFYNQFERQYDVIRGMGIQTGRIVLNEWPHGFGSDGGWVEDYADWLEKIFKEEHA